MPINEEIIKPAPDTNAAPDKQPEQLPKFTETELEQKIDNANPEELEKLFNGNFEITPDTKVEEPTKTEDNSIQAGNSDKATKDDLNIIPEDLLNKYGLDKFKGKTVIEILESYTNLEKAFSKKSTDKNQPTEFNQQPTLPSNQLPLRITPQIRSELRNFAIQRLRDQGIEYPLTDDDYDEIAISKPSLARRLDMALEAEMPVVIDMYHRNLAKTQNEWDIVQNEKNINNQNAHKFIQDADQLMKEAGVEGFIDKEGKFIQANIDQWLKPIIEPNGQLNIGIMDEYIHPQTKQKVYILNPEKAFNSLFATHSKRLIQLAKENGIRQGRTDISQGINNPEKITTMANKPKGIASKEVPNVDPDNMSLDQIEEALTKLRK